MNRWAWWGAILALGVLTGAAGLQAQAPPGSPFPPPVVPENFGVNIHFTNPRPGEMKMLADAGFRWVRMDFSWEGIEKEKGKYDFSAYDGLMAALTPLHIRPIFILDYSNRLYDGGQSPQTDEGRQAFARWAAASAVHFGGRGVLWEMYNEPNIGFWRPTPNTDQYTALALAVGKALKESAPAETYIGPASSTIAFPFLEACFKAGLLQYWSAVSVHPYRQSAPEEVIPEYRRLRAMIQRYAPAGRSIPIISSEWGYSSAWGNMDEAKQGAMLPRELLTNLAQNVPVSIWYDWHDDGVDPKDGEHHFGTVHYDYHEGRDPVYDPKPAYLAARTLSTELGGFRFSKRLAVGGPDDYIYLFSKGDDVRLVAWTVSGTHEVTIPVSPGAFVRIGHTGEKLPSVTASGTADRTGLTVTLTPEPQYLEPEKPNDLLRVAAAWERLPLEMAEAGPATLQIGLSLKNPLNHRIRVQAGSAQGEADPGATLEVTSGILLSRSERPQPVRIEWNINGMGAIAQQTEAIVTNPIAITVLPIEANLLPVRIDNPSGQVFQGTVEVSQVQGLRSPYWTTPVNLGVGMKEKTVRFPLEAPPTADYSLAVRVTERGRNASSPTALDLPAAHYRRLDNFAHYPAHETPPGYSLVADGDPKVGSELSLTSDLPPEGAPAPAMGALKISYHFQPGWKFLRLVPEGYTQRTMEGKPRTLGLWIYGDGQGNLPRLRFTDSTGQTFQPGSDPVTWKGWRYVQFSMDNPQAGHWGGANDGVIHYPIRWDSLFLLDSAQRHESQGVVYLSAPTVEW